MTVKSSMRGNPKRLLFLTPNYGAISEIWMRRQAEGLSEFDVKVVCNRFYETPGTKIPLVLPRGLLRRCLLRLRASESLADRLCMSPFHAGGRARIERCERAAWAEILERFNPDVALVHFGMQACRYGFLLSEQSIPFAVHFNGLDLSKNLSNRYYVDQLRQVIPLASKLVVVADYMSEWLLRNGAAERQVIKIPYGTPCSDHRVPGQPKSTDDGLIHFLMVGRLTAKKAPLITIRAFLKVAKTNPKMHLDVVGDGELKSQVIDYLNEHDPDHRVHLHGALPFRKVKAALKNADVFLQHSITPPCGDREGWPVAIAEAAAFGLPIVSTDHASIPEQVLDGTTGFIVPEGDLDGMAAAMQKLASDRQLRHEMSGQAKAHMANFQVSQQILKLQNVLQEISNV